MKTLNVIIILFVVLSITNLFLYVYCVKYPSYKTSKYDYTPALEAFANHKGLESVKIVGKPIKKENQPSQSPTKEEPDKIVCENKSLNELHTFAKTPIQPNQISCIAPLGDPSEFYKKLRRPYVIPIDKITGYNYKVYYGLGNIMDIGITVQDNKDTGGLPNPYNW